MNERRDFWPVIFLTLVMIGSVGLLTLTDVITRDKIAQAKAEAIKEMLASLFPNMDSFRYDEASGVYTVLAGGEPIGHAFMAQGHGYGGPIDILVGIKPDNASLQGIKIISQQETPGLGAKITTPSFLKQFEGLPVEAIELSRNGGKVDAITGATISSTAVVRAVKEAVERFLRQEGEKP
jgi:electron transport complex protein RnfG